MCQCGTCPSGNLPTAYANVFIGWCDTYGTPSIVSVELRVEASEDDPQLIVNRQFAPGPFDTEADIRRFVDNALMEAIAAERAWRRVT